jgi:methylthioribose-1-phosphate isomerase
VAAASVQPVEWLGDRIRVLDQTRLPGAERSFVCRTPAQVADAIRSLAVRGAPLLGIVAGYGMAIAATGSKARSVAQLQRDLDKAGDLLIRSRPTAVNVRWAVERVLETTRTAAERRSRPATVESVRRAAVAEAMAIAREDRESCRAIGLFGRELVPQGANVLHHCNTGALATGGAGTAQSVITAAHRAGKKIHVWVDETRPVLQGARLTAWELGKLGVPMTLVADSAAGSLMSRGLVDMIVVGADRIAANGDVANKIGTYSLAVLARHHGVPFYVAAPLSTVDPDTRTGKDIVIEERNAKEVVAPMGMAIAPRGTRAANPAFDVTPARLIAAIITDRGVARAPYRTSLRRLEAQG